MRDPIEELESFTSPGLTMNPMPASEVRRRGTRLRRRNTALATVGGIAAVAIIATPFAVAAGGHDSSNPIAPATQIATDWVTTIPAGFPLTDGMPEKNGHDGSPVKARDSYEPQGVDVCEGTEGWSPGEATDVSQATYTGESEGGQDRTLALYSDDRAAATELTSLTARVEACATSSAGDNRYAEVVASDAHSLSYVDHMEAGAMFVRTVQQVGNALLLDTTYAMSGGDPQVVQQTVGLLTDKSSGVVDAMCAFAPDPC